MVPTSAVLRSKPPVGTLAERGDGALGDTGDTVLVVGADLTNTMPVDGGGVVGQQIGNHDFDPVTVIDFDRGARGAAVDQEGRAQGAIEVGLGRGDGQGKLLGLARFVVSVDFVADILAAPEATVVGGVVVATAGFWQGGEGLRGKARRGRRG